MILTPEQQALLDGSRGETMAKVMKTLVMYGDAFGAERMVPVTSKYGHTVISFGLKAIKPVYELYDGERPEIHRRPQAARPQGPLLPAGGHRVQEDHVHRPEAL